ncbi:MAG: MMPL family transporter [Caloramator sp.]|nr:MMPL family transporter [Caloramator sp.]
MNKLCEFVVKYKKIIIIVFLIFAVFGAIFASIVSINYNMADYLPKKTNSTTAINIMKNEFKDEIPNAKVMIKNVTIIEALKFKEKISSIDGVKSVNWIDDVIGIDRLTTTPLEFLDESILKNYYKDKNALFTVTIEKGKERNTVDLIYNLIGKDNAIAGDAVNTALSQKMSYSEVIKAFEILLPIILIILVLYTTSWIEPLLFLLSIGIAILINMGTNIFFGEISFLTQSISPILQLAVSLDYAIFLLHSFNEYRAEYDENQAMKLAIKKSITTISASASTTIVGFFALIFMRFGIGKDLGLNLIKGIMFSFISSVIFLPSVTLCCYRFIDKFKHRQLIPSLKGIGKYILKINTAILIISVIVAVPCYLAKSKVEFVYGNKSADDKSRIVKDSINIEKIFGKENTFVLLVPKGYKDKELKLCDKLSDIPHIDSVISYVTAVGAQIPSEYLPDELVKKFYSNNYVRIFIYTDLNNEGNEAFTTVQTVLSTANKYYNTYYLAGETASLYDMKNVVSKDTKLVNLIAVIGILIVLLLTFKSAISPLLLLFTIETAIWINLSFAYFSGKSFNFIGYLVISTVQLGATVDYAILMTERYLRFRKELNSKDAMERTIDDNLIAVLISSAILSTAGFTLALTSSNPIVSELGELLGRGTLLSFIMVACVLPALLVHFDKVIQKTTLH